MKNIFLFFIICIILNTVNAYSIPYTVYNYKTLQPVENANISIYNSTFFTSQLTDVNGYALFDLNGTFSINIHKSLYADYDSSINITNDTTNSDIYLVPYSHTGIVRVTFSDITGLEHKNSFYFDNGRLEGIYNANETIILHNNMVYEWIPIITRDDILFNPYNFLKYIFVLSGSAIMIILFICLIVFVLFCLLMAYWFLKRNKTK